MFCAVYRMKVNPTGEQQFREAWHEVTKVLVDSYGSLGARLHRSHDDGSLIAYAQWPNRELWEAGHVVIHERSHQLHLEECLLEIPTVLLELTVLDDLLQSLGVL